MEGHRTLPYLVIPKCIYRAGSTPMKNSSHPPPKKKVRWSSRARFSKSKKRGGSKRGRGYVVPSSCAMSIYPLKQISEELYDGSCFEGIPVTEQYHCVGEDEYLLPGISWFGLAELINMKMATIVIPYHRREGGAIGEGLAYESGFILFFLR
jgi:hypothetical protein